jgi:hypothetical protein
MMYSKHMDKAYFKFKNRSIVSEKKATPLSVSMNQGGGYDNGLPPKGLSNQMGQPGGYDHSLGSLKLRDKMGQ